MGDGDVDHTACGHRIGLRMGGAGLFQLGDGRCRPPAARGQRHLPGPLVGAARLTCRSGRRPCRRFTTRMATAKLGTTLYENHNLLFNKQIGYLVTVFSPPQVTGMDRAKTVSRSWQTDDPSPTGSETAT